jgi:translation initiation factor 2 beta subunit (eIF-2beta)/eIF-5
MYPFCDNTQTVPQESVYPLQHYADVTVDGKSPSETSQKIHIEELTIALKKQHEQTKYFHDTLQKLLYDKTTNEHRISNCHEDTVLQLEADKERLKYITKDLMDKSSLYHASMGELRRENIELVSKNKIYQMNERMQHLFTN